MAAPVLVSGWHDKAFLAALADLDHQPARASLDQILARGDGEILWRQVLRVAILEIHNLAFSQLPSFLLDDQIAVYENASGQRVG